MRRTSSDTCTDGPVVTGKPALRESMAERMAKDTSSTTRAFKVQELFVGEDHMTEIGTWTDANANGEVVAHGTYLCVFRRTGDGWECIREIAVSAKPEEEGDHGN